MRKALVPVLFAIALMTMFAGTALAAHDHYLVTPGHCVADIASGQTAKDAGEGGYHKFHENVHLGQPGSVAFQNPANPVAVFKDGTGPGC